MTLEEIESEVGKLEAAYEIRDGIIRSPGKFEGEPVWVPYLYAENPSNSLLDEDDTEVLIYEISDAERQAFPSLGGVEFVALHEDDVGFVHKLTMTRAEYEDLERKCSEQQNLHPSPTR